jgi:protein N-terminal methyltransferase
MPAKNIEDTIDREENFQGEHIDCLINYDDAITYWTDVPATVDGVLGGFGESTSVPKADVVGSSTFMRKLKTRWSAEPGKLKYGFDFGAGIGRVTRDFLHKICDKVDLLEPVKPFVDQMRIELKDLNEQGKIGEIYEIPMQDWKSEQGKYALLWCQWCVGHLPDDAFLDWLDQCKNGLQQDGILIVKENNTNDDNDIFDPEDSSKTRSDKNFRQLFKQGGWKLVATDLQKGVPKELYPIRMYALKPIGE